MGSPTGIDNKPTAYQTSALQLGYVPCPHLTADVQSIRENVLCVFKKCIRRVKWRRVCRAACILSLFGFWLKVNKYRVRLSGG